MSNLAKKDLLDQMKKTTPDPVRKRLMIQLDYPEEVEITVLARIVDIITDIPGVKYTNNGGSITVPEGSKVVKITEVYPTVDIQKAFERPIQQ